MKISDRFEHQIRRIHQLIEQPDSAITWNDRIPDPDNPKQSRQIDISQKIGTAPIIIDRLIHCYELLVCQAYQELREQVFLFMLFRGEIIRNVFLRRRMISGNI